LVIATSICGVQFQTEHTGERSRHINRLQPGELTSWQRLKVAILTRNI